MSTSCPRSSTASASTRLPPSSRRACRVARLKRAIEEGHVRVNGAAAPKGAPVATGETITIARDEVAAPDEPATPEPEAPARRALRGRLAVLVVDKPAGQPTAPLRAGERGTLANALVGHYPELAGVGYGPREPGILHRLDTNTSGLVVVARTRGRLRRASRAALQDGRHPQEVPARLQERRPRRRGHHRAPASRTTRRTSAACSRASTRATSCATRRARRRRSYRVLERRGETDALVEVDVAKALRHQIRVHFAAIGSPARRRRALREHRDEGLGSRHALHASFVGFDGDEWRPELRGGVDRSRPSSTPLHSTDASQRARERPRAKSSSRREQAHDDVGLVLECRRTSRDGRTRRARARARHVSISGLDARHAQRRVPAALDVEHGRRRPRDRAMRRASRFVRVRAGDRAARAGRAPRGARGSACCTGVATERYASAIHSSRSTRRGDRAPRRRRAIIHAELHLRQRRELREPAEREDQRRRAPPARRTRRGPAERREISVYVANTSSHTIGRPSSSIAVELRPRVRYDPVGLFGLTTRMARVRGVTAAERKLRGRRATRRRRASRYGTRRTSRSSAS